MADEGNGATDQFDASEVWFGPEFDEGVGFCVVSAVGGGEAGGGEDGCGEGEGEEVHSWGFLERYVDWIDSEVGIGVICE